MCTDNIYDSVVTSPNYPNNYPDSYINTWTISVGATQTVVFELRDLDIESRLLEPDEDTDIHGYTDAPCRYDWLRVSGCHQSKADSLFRRSGK